jgi:hypothetical protein
MIKHSHDDSVIMNINRLNNCKLATALLKDFLIKRQERKSKNYHTSNRYLLSAYNKSKPPLFI